MISSTSGLELKTNRRWLAEAVELVSSMRFAISLLVLIAIAATIGTVLKQNEPFPNYINQFGAFWFEIFGRLGLYTVYSTWWFLLAMATLMVSTSLCIARNAPKMLKDMRSWRENVREQSLRNFHHKAEWTASQTSSELVPLLIQGLVANGYKVKAIAKEAGILVSAKRGAANKWGYILAHSAIVIIMLGGVLDSDLSIRFQEWFLGKVPYNGNGIIAQIPPQHRLSVSNPSFRGNTFIAEGASTNTAIIPRGNGALVQDLPFTIQLQKFVIDFYSTGMPKLFASHVTVFDPENGKRFNAVIKVNEPLIYKGMAVYQSSFEDGGSKLSLNVYPMIGTVSEPIAISGEVGRSTPLMKGGEGGYTVEWSGFRAFNVENMARNGADVRAVDANKSFNQQFAEGIDKRLGAAAKSDGVKDFKNLGPSVQYKLRDKTGQAREFHTYMAPVLIEGHLMYLAGVRDNPNENFRYLRIPADDKGAVEEWMRLRAALMNPELRGQAAQRYALRAMPDANANAATNAANAQLREQLQQSAERSLMIFAGNEQESGYMAVTRFLQKLPRDQQEKAADIFMKIMNGSMWELWQLSRQKAGLPPAEANDNNARFMQLAVNALADSFIFAAPVYLQLKDFTEIKASVLQVSRSPGKKVVYLGCLLLVLGVFAMLYIRESRLWIWLKPDRNGATQALMAMSTQRKTLDFEREFEQLKTQLTGRGES